MSDRPEDLLLRALALAQLDRLLAELDRLGLAAGSARVHIDRANSVYLATLTIQRLQAQGDLVRLPVPGPAPAPTASGTGRPDKPPRLRRIHRKLLEKASATPTPAKAIITRAGYKANSYARDAITELIRWGYLKRDDDGRGLVLLRSA